MIYFKVKLSNFFFKSVLKGFTQKLLNLKFTNPQAILGVYDFLLLAKHNRSYIKKIFLLFQAL